jgi:lactate dehydrogenase-like 2-hydroxyacid dehydrogenase
MTKTCLCTWKLPGRWPADLPKVLNAHDIELRLNPLGRWYTESELVHELRDVDAVLAGLDPYTASVMESAKKLKIIARMGVGYDRIDLAAATRKGIYVTYTPVPEFAKGVADETFALLLSVVRKVPQMDMHVRAGGYDVEGMASKALDIYPLTLGIIGLGRIGVEVARRARGFEMKVLYHDKSRRQDLEEQWGLQYVSLDELLRNSDIVTIHAPLTPETAGLIGKREISLMKKDAVILNAARGQIIQEKPLYEALVEGRLGGAGLSVLSEEPPTADCPFYKLGDKLPNLVLLPHIGAGKNTNRVIALTAVEDVIAVLDGRKPKHVLNKELLSS